jgi:hypothetical protein
VGYVIDFDDNYTVRSVHSSTTAAASFATLQDCSTTALVDISDHHCMH